MLRRSTAWLEKRGIDDRPRLDVEILMAHVLGVQRLDLYLQFDRPLGDDELDGIRKLVVQRGDRRPIAYLVGEKEFFSLTFEVDERVLVPRPETELLVETALKRLAGAEAPVVLDVGTGSGCIPVALLHEREDLTAIATDISAGALEVAAANAARHEVEGRLELLEGDLLAPVRALPAWGSLAAVLSNPPYIVAGDPTVAPDVHEHEPHRALYVAGEDPLALARAIAVEAREALAPGRFLAMEVGHESGGPAKAMLEELGYEAVELVKDLAGIERVVVGVKAP